MSIIENSCLSAIEAPEMDDPTGVGERWYARVKTAADVATAAVLLIAFAPLIVILMVLVKLTSHGPAIYSQLRTGWNGQEYWIYKLRTMTHNCERETGPQWSSGRRDARVTPLGRFLRRSHLDELPQLWNVIRGEMSLVGPRPERPEFVAKLERDIPDYRLRIRVRPGITGLAQVQLPPDEDVEHVRRKLRYDLCYIRQVDAWLDFRILSATVLKVIGVPPEITRRVLALPGSTPPAALLAPAEPGPRNQYGS